MGFNSEFKGLTHFFQYRDEASLVRPEDRYVRNDSDKYISR